MKEGKDIDKLFKDGLENPDLPFNDLDWDNLEERLHPIPKRKVLPLFWLTAAAVIAAMLLIVFLLVKPSNHKTDVKAVVKTNKEDQNQTKTQNNSGALTDVPAKQIVPDVNADSNLFAINQRNAAEHGKQQQKSNTEIEQKLIQNGINNANTLANLAYQPTLSSENNPIEFKDQKMAANVEVGKPERIKPLVVKQKSRLILSILAAPDLTSVQKSGTSNLSGGFGVEATYMITKRLSISTGASYAKKIYDSDFNLYKPNTSYVFKIAPSNIHANCDVIDIPLNVNYKIFENNRNSISVSTGLSSYIMVKERYTYSYDGVYQGQQGWEVKGQNQHYLGIANVGVEFQHKINNNLSISAKPFMKIPLTDIGYGNSRLSSTGLAVSVNMNLFKKN